MNRRSVIDHLELGRAPTVFVSIVIVLVIAIQDLRAK